MRTERAGVSIGSVYQYFSSKDARTLALTEGVGCGVQAFIARLLQAS
ncbi:TetR family transcriptional regulator [Bradyrhizobium canariense]|nr:TetR family transcriptional regulator [Bradyrhizobium canariense]